MKAAILSACDITPPPEGISDVFMDRGLYVRWSPSNGEWIVSKLEPDVPLSSMGFADGSDALARCRVTAEVPMGQALRAWMRAKGWVPRKERTPIDPTANTRTVM